MQKYIKELCDITDIQSDEESQRNLGWGGPQGNIECQISTEISTCAHTVVSPTIDS